MLFTKKFLIPDLIGIFYFYYYYIFFLITGSPQNMAYFRWSPEIQLWCSGIYSGYKNIGAQNVKNIIYKIINNVLVFFSAL